MRSKRIDEVLEYIYENKTVSLDKLCEIFNVSKNTIRRDLEYLSEKALIRKVYGGVTIMQSNKIVSYEDRTIKNSSPKLSIAKTAAEYIDDGDSIFLDSGTTTVNIIDSLADKKNITIFTTNLTAIIKALPYNNLKIITLSGVLNRETNSFTGINCTEILKNYNIKKCFMACTGISLENGVTNSSYLECEIKKAAIEKSAYRFLLTDSTKFDNIALMTFCDLKDLNYIITDRMPSNKFVSYFKDNDINLILSN